MKATIIKAGLFVTLATSTAVHAQAPGLDLDNADAPDKATPLAQWTPAQQWSKARTSWGYSGGFGLLVFGDELGDKLSELGRVQVIKSCFDHAKESAESALMWAVCGPDVGALDIKKLEAEVKASGIRADSQKWAIEQAQSTLAKAKKIGEVVEAAAKDDPGVAQVLKLGIDAREEWKKYLAANKPAFERYLALKDAVRSSKSNHKSFAGCWEATQPAFAKLVKKTKFPWEVSGDYLPAYVAELLTSAENYITAASFAACAYSIDKSGEALAAATLSQDIGGTIRVGPRTITIGKAMDASFAPKFADRSLSWANMIPYDIRRSGYKMGGVNDLLKMMTPVQGEIHSVKPDGEMTKIAFATAMEETCLQWKETRKVISYGVNGDPIYDKKCVKRGKVDQKADETPIATKFAAGAKAKTSVWIVGGFPVTVWNKNGFVAVLGVACNCGTK